jgi:hypothetical protein
MSIVGRTCCSMEQASIPYAKELYDGSSGISHRTIVSDLQSSVL